MKYIDTRPPRRLSEITRSDLGRIEAAAFERDFSRSRHNMDARCSECRGRGCGYCEEERHGA